MSYKNEIGFAEHLGRLIVSFLCLFCAIAVFCGWMEPDLRIASSMSFLAIGYVVLRRFND